MSKESARASAEHRRQIVAAAKKAEQRRRNATRFGVIGGIVVVAVVIVIVIVSVTRPTTPTATPAVDASKQIIPSGPTTSDVTQQAVVKTVNNTTGIQGVLAWDTDGWPGDGTTHTGALEHNHVTGPVRYVVTPPVGGPHDPVWMNAGVYTKPLPVARAVHNLEHGAVWITYDPNLPAKEIKELTAFVTKQTLIPEDLSSFGISNAKNRYVDLSPWASNTLPSPIVISSWGYQLRVTSPTDPRLQQFVDTLRYKQKYSPEFGGPVDGVPVQTGGRPALDGGTQPNPPGIASE
ncbi:MAG TPA: DUF3105 domain-containing protein [Galbitalea sp.]|jgi:hypothetical protein|nr:DUF3105 domain-containing protein [Galbitalea sp.]